MGMKLMSSCGSCAPVAPRMPVPNRLGALPNPDPRKFKVRSVQVFKRAAVLTVDYSGCTNYEGRKVLVFKVKSEAEAKRIAASAELDPHFCEHDERMVARFRPSVAGMQLAREFAEMLGEKK